MEEIDRSRSTSRLVTFTNELQNRITQKQSMYPLGFPKKVFAEVIGTYLLVFVGSGAAAMNSIDENKVSKLGASLAGGFIVTVMIYAIGHISGAHMNPAVSLAFATVKHFPWKQVPFYIAAQLTGAISASYTLRVLLEPSKQLGATSPSGSNIQALIIEIVTTFTMVFISTAVATDSKATGELSGVAVGSSVSIASIVAGPISGGSMNPARTLGPAIATSSYKGIWIYMVGPITGALLGAWSYVVIQETDHKQDLATSSSTEVHFSGFHMDNGLEQRKAGTEEPTTSAFDEYRQPFVIGVAGGSASGKTAVCDMIIQQLHDQRVVLVNQDSFYHNLTKEQLTRVQEYNFDHPEAFDSERLLSVMDKLKHSQAVDIPKYDFKCYKNDVFPARRVNPADVIILEGILVFHDPRVRALMNMKIFVDTDADVRLARRIKRDTADNARNIEAVLDQYSKFVKPAFDDFILPTKKYADIIIPRGGDNHVAIDLIVQHIRTKLGQHDLCKIYPNLYVIHSTFQIRGMHTLIRDSQTKKHDFVFYADRLIRLVVEQGLGHLPFTEKQVIAPTGSVYSGVDFCKRLCGVSVIRSGESMENALRACCKGIKIGKILIHREGDNGQQLIYEKLPNDISDRHVLLLDPILGTGNSAVQAISLIIRKGVPESNIIFLNLISAPQGLHVVCKRFPRIKIVTSEIDNGLNEDFRVVPGMGEFGDRYFGTDDDDELEESRSR